MVVLDVHASPEDVFELLTRFSRYVLLLPDWRTSSSSYSFLSALNIVSLQLFNFLWDVDMNLLYLPCDRSPYMGLQKKQIR